MRSSHAGWLSCVVIALTVALLIMSRTPREIVVTELTVVPATVEGDVALSGIYQFEVIEGPLRIRDAPDGEILESKMSAGDTFTANLMDQTIAGDAVWIKHERGYSALHSVDGSRRFVTIVGILPQSLPPSATHAAPFLLPPTAQLDE